jgi:hypothetical protein
VSIVFRNDLKRFPVIIPDVRGCRVDAVSQFLVIRAGQGDAENISHYNLDDIESYHTYTMTEPVLYAQPQY